MADKSTAPRWAQEIGLTTRRQSIAYMAKNTGFGGDTKGQKAYQKFVTELRQNVREGKLPKSVLEQWKRTQKAVQKNPVKPGHDVTNKGRFALYDMARVLHDLHPQDYFQSSVFDI